MFSAISCQYFLNFTLLRIISYNLISKMYYGSLMQTRVRSQRQHYTGCQQQSFRAKIFVSTNFHEILLIIRWQAISDFDSVISLTRMVKSVQSVFLFDKNCVGNHNNALYLSCLRLLTEFGENLDNLNRNRWSYKFYDSKVCISNTHFYTKVIL